MCFFGGGEDNSAEIAAQQAAEARAAEQRREATIKASIGHVDNAFNSTFNNAYYDKINKDYLAYYTPQLQDKYAQAQKQMQLSYADRGMLGSTEAAEKLAQLSKMNDQTMTDLSSQAQNQVTEAKRAVETQRGNLMAQANGGAALDPSVIQGTVGNISAPRATGQLGDIFSGLISGAQGAMQGATANKLTQGGPGTGVFDIFKPSQSVIN